MSLFTTSSFPWHIDRTLMLPLLGNMFFFTARLPVLSSHLLSCWDSLNSWQIRCRCWDILGFVTQMSARSRGRLFSSIAEGHRGTTDESMINIAFLLFLRRFIRVYYATKYRSGLQFPSPDQCSAVKGVCSNTPTTLILKNRWQKLTSCASWSTGMQHPHPRCSLHGNRLINVVDKDKNSGWPSPSAAAGCMAAVGSSEPAPLRWILLLVPSGCPATLLTSIPKGFWWGCRFSRPRLDPEQVVRDTGY